MFMSSGEPVLYLAERPLYNWSEWHGGEAGWVKAVLIANWLPFVATRFFDDSLSVASFRSTSFPLRRQSWLVAWFFLGLSSVQWLLVGWAIGRVRRAV